MYIPEKALGACLDAISKQKIGNCEKQRKLLMNNLFDIWWKQIRKTYAFLTSDIVREPFKGRPRTVLWDRDSKIKDSSSQEDSSSQFLLLWDWFVQLKPSLHSNPDVSLFLCLSRIPRFGSPKCHSFYLQANTIHKHYAIYSLAFLKIIKICIETNPWICYKAFWTMTWKYYSPGE